MADARADSRRRSILALVAISLLAVVACQPSVWTHGRGSAGLTGSNDVDKQITPDNVAAMQLEWSATNTGAVPTRANSPVVSDDTVLLTTTDGTLVAYDATGDRGCTGTPRSCSPLWTAPLGAPVFGSPAIDAGIVYVIAGNRTGSLLAFDIHGSVNCTGDPTVCSPLWRASAGSYGSPTVADGHVAVYDTGQDRMEIYDAFGEDGCDGDPVTCDPLWVSAPGPGPNYYAKSGTPAIDDGQVVEPLTPGATHAVYSGYDLDGTGCAGSPPDCSPTWRFSFGVMYGSDMAVRDDVGYVAHGGLYAIDLANCPAPPGNCPVLWQISAATDAAMPTVTPTSVLWRRTDRLSAHDPRTGDQRWSWANVTTLPTPASTTNGVAFVGSSDDHLYALDVAGTRQCNAGTCQPIWSAQLGGDVGAPAIAFGRVYVVSGDGTLSVFRVPPGLA